MVLLVGYLKDSDRISDSQIEAVAALSLRSFPASPAPPSCTLAPICVP